MSTSVYQVTLWLSVNHLNRCLKSVSKVSQKYLKRLSKVSPKSLNSLSKVSQKSLKSLSKVSQKSLNSLSKVSQKSSRWNQKSYLLTHWQNHLLSCPGRLKKGDQFRFLNFLAHSTYLTESYWGVEGEVASSVRFISSCFKSKSLCPFHHWMRFLFFSIVIFSALPPHTHIVKHAITAYNL